MEQHCCGMDCPNEIIALISNLILMSKYLPILVYTKNNNTLIPTILKFCLLDDFKDTFQFKHFDYNLH